MLALLSRFFLQSTSLCLVWLEEGGDEDELVLARESSSDIPVWSLEMSRNLRERRPEQPKRADVLTPPPLQEADASRFHNARATFTIYKHTLAFLTDGGFYVPAAAEAEILSRFILVLTDPDEDDVLWFAFF